MNLEQPFLPSNNGMMSPQNMNQPRFVPHQMGAGQGYGSGGGGVGIQQPPPLISHSPQQFGFGGGMRSGGYMAQAPPQQQIPEHLMPSFEHPTSRPPQGVPMNRGGNAGGWTMNDGGISGVPNFNHRNIPQNMLKDQPMVNENMPGYTPQMFNHNSSSPLGASLGSGRNMGPIGNSQSVNFPDTHNWANQTDNWDGGVVRNYPGSGAFRGALHNPHEISDPRQMSSFDRNRHGFQTGGGGGGGKTPIDYVGFNAQGEKVYDTQYYQNTPGRRDTTEFYAKYKKTPNQQLLPGNADQNAGSYMGYIPPVNHQQAQAQAHVQAMRMRNGQMLDDGMSPRTENLMKAPLNQRNLQNFQGRRQPNAVPRR